MTAVNLPLRQIKTTGGTQPRAKIDEAVVADYARAQRSGEKFPPVVVYYDGRDYWLADGFHRLAAAQLMCVRTISADVRQGTLRDAVLHSVGANATHGLRRSNADKQRAVRTLLGDVEWQQWSDREIARRCGVDHKMVRTMRHKLSGEMPQIATLDRLARRGQSTYRMHPEDKRAARHGGSRGPVDIPDEIAPDNRRSRLSPSAIGEMQRARERMESIESRGDYETARRDYEDARDRSYEAGEADRAVELMESARSTTQPDTPAPWTLPPLTTFQQLADGDIDIPVCPIPDGAADAASDSTASDPPAHLARAIGKMPHPCRYCDAPNCRADHNWDGLDIAAIDDALDSAPDMPDADRYELYRQYRALRGNLRRYDLYIHDFLGRDGAMALKREVDRGRLDEACRDWSRLCEARERIKRGDMSSLRELAQLVFDIGVALVCHPQMRPEHQARVRELFERVLATGFGQEGAAK